MHQMKFRLSEIGGERLKAYCFMLLFIPQVVFYFVSQHLGLTYHPVSCAIDNVIPFMPIFILPYASWGLYVPLMLFAMATAEPGGFAKRILWFFAGVLFSFLLFVIYPTCITFRPALGNGFFDKLCGIAFSNDNPVNVFPSLHCYEALAVHSLAFIKGPFSQKKGLRIASAVLTVLICLSTVFIKQHSVIDVLGGLALAVVIFLLYYFTSAFHKSE